MRTAGTAQKNGAARQLRYSGMMRRSRRMLSGPCVGRIGWATVRTPTRVELLAADGRPAPRSPSSPIPMRFTHRSACALTVCWMLIGAKGKWWLKLATILIVPGFGLAVWASIASYKGWPTTDEPPEKAVLVWGIIHEPDPKHGDPGSIYLWLTPLQKEGDTALNPLDYVSGGGEPRSYKLPYTRQLHDALSGAQAAAKDGRPMMFSRNPKRGGERGGRPRNREEDATEGDESATSGGAGGNARGDGEQFQFYDLPLPTSPRKEPER